MRRRVVITGLGAVTSIGIGAAAFRDGLRQGVSGMREPIIGFDTTGFACRRAGEVQDFDPARWVHRLDPSTLGRSSQFSVAAARMAIEDAGIDPSLLQRERCGVSIGTTEGEPRVEATLVEQWLAAGPEHLDPALLRQAPAEQLSRSVAREFHLSGETITLSTACAAGNYAVAYAFDLIQSGEADWMLCGGADSLSRTALAGFYRLGAISPDHCRPFDANRQGFFTGEGAGVLLLETVESARARGAHIYAEMLGYGLNCDASQPTAPELESIVRCMRLAHARAGVRPDDVDYICAHGTATRLNDVVESAAIREVFGDRPLPVSSIKSMLGHTMGAASALASVACALALDGGFLPPTINFETPDPQCVADCVPNTMRPADLRVIQNNSFAFGGNNAIILFGKHAANL